MNIKISTRILFLGFIIALAMLFLGKAIISAKYFPSQRSRINKVKKSLRSIKCISRHILDYQAQWQHYPLPGHHGLAKDLAPLLDQTAMKNECIDGYVDGWGRDILYLSDQDGLFFALVSLGKNGKQDYPFNIDNLPPLWYSLAGEDNDDFIDINACTVQNAEGNSCGCNPEDFEKPYYEKMLKRAEEKLQKNPNDYEAMLNKGIACSYFGSYDNAVILFERAKERIQIDAHASYYLGLSLFSLERFNDAIPFLVRAIEGGKSNKTNVHRGTEYESNARELISQANIFMIELAKNKVAEEKDEATPIFYPINFKDKKRCKNTLNYYNYVFSSAANAPLLPRYLIAQMSYAIGGKTEAIISLKEIARKSPYFKNRALQDLKSIDPDVEANKELTEMLK